MADRFPLILNTSANQIQEIASGDTLDLTDVNISNAGVITATSFAGDGSGLIGVASTDNIVTGTAATFNTFPIDINAGMDVAGVSTFAGNIDANGDLDVDGHTNLDHVSITGVTTVKDIILEDTSPVLSFKDTNADADNKTWHFKCVTSNAFQIQAINDSGSGGGGLFKFTRTGSNLDTLQGTRSAITWFTVDNVNRKVTTRDLDVTNDLDVDGHTNLDNVSVAGVTTFTGDATFSGNVSIGGTLTYEDVTNIDSIGIITARNGLNVSGGNVTIAKDIDVDGHTTLDNVNIAGVTTITNSSGTKTFEATNNGIQLLHNGLERVSTNTTGIDVNGTLGADSINCSGIASATSFKGPSGVTATFIGDGSGLTNIGISTEQVTPSSNVATLDLSKDEHKIVASGTYTVDVSGGTESESHVIRIENSGISTVGFSTYFKFPSGGTPALPTASGAISLISFTVHKVGSVGIATVLLAGASVNYS